VAGRTEDERSRWPSWWPAIVCCPTCKSAAQIAPVGDDDELLRFACSSCGLEREGEAAWTMGAGIVRIREPDATPARRFSMTRKRPPEPEEHDYALWLRRTHSSGQELWAFNEEHLDYLERYLRASLHDDALAWRLPTWMRDEGNVEEVFEGIARMRASIKAPRSPPAD